MLGIIGPAVALIGAGAVGWALCKAAGDADDRMAQMEIDADQAWIADAKARAAVARSRDGEPCSRPANVITFPSRRPYDWSTERGL